MAYNLRKINPLDLQPRTGIGIDIPFSGENVFNVTYTTKDAIRANLINFLLTGKNERIFRPNFGAGLRSLLFENINSDIVELYKTDILNQIRSNFKNINVTKFEIIFYPEYNSLDITFNYSIKDTNIQDEILINIEG